MKHLRVLPWLIAILLGGLLLGWPAQIARAQSPEPPVPEGFRQIDAAIGATLYRKDYPGGSPDFVQVIDLSMGAGIVLQHGGVVGQRGDGAYGGDNAAFARTSLPKYWQQLTTMTATPFCVTNGQFFLMAENPGPLPFPLKVDGNILTDGYGLQDYPDQKLILELWPDHANIQPLTRDSLYNSSAPNVVAGLTEEANKHSPRYLGRTFVGLDDRDSDGQRETVLIFNTLSARQVDAADVLRSFGADQVMMLDGGGSTQLICQGDWKVKSERVIPQALGIFSAASAPQEEFAATPGEPSGLPILTPGERVLLEIQVTNSGGKPWSAGLDKLVLEAPWGLRDTLRLKQDVAPGESVSLTWRLAAPTAEGFQLVEGHMMRGQQVFSGDPVLLNLLIVPPELDGRKQELADQINRWVTEGAADPQALAQEWIETQRQAPLIEAQSQPQAAQSQSQTPQMEQETVSAAPPPESGALFDPQFNLNAVLIIPVVMAPVVLVLLLAILRIRGGS